MSVKAKQIEKFLQGWVGIAGLATAGGTSDTITTVLTTALNTAGNGGVSVPLQVGSNAQMGVNTSTGFNTTPIYQGGSKDFYLDANGQEVYGKITVSGSTWTLSYFSIVGTTETAFTMPASAQVDFEVPYVFSFDALPMTAITSLVNRHIAPDPSANGQRFQPDVLTVTAANVVSALSRAYAGPYAMLIVNGVVYTNFGPAAPFSVSGTAVTWSAANAGFPLATSDEVKAIYGY
jgi:hypothetical protein